eukprot:Lithocolla_globosa_v1_NODE_4914_length_1340_cov_3.838911.p2 type:complete len:142 gc:universal NODE_4914_length_1340_cov_3.838911:460-35(-)
MSHRNIQFLDSINYLFPLHCTQSHRNIHIQGFYLYTHYPDHYNVHHTLHLGRWHPHLRHYPHYNQPDKYIGNPGSDLHSHCLERCRLRCNSGQDKGHHRWYCWHRNTQLGNNTCNLLQCLHIRRFGCIDSNKFDRYRPCFD